MSARLDRRRLALVADRFASPHDGERLAALEAAGRILAAGGLSWRELIDGATAKAHDDDQGEPIAAPHHEIAMALARSGAGVLTAWELRFLRGLLTFSTLSAKQRAMLEGIKAKLLADAWCDA